MFDRHAGRRAVLSPRRVRRDVLFGKPRMTRYIGSGEAASYRRLPPSGPLGPFMARTPARPDGANLNRLPRGGGSRFGALGEVRLTGVHDARVGQHVDERRLARRERALERGLQLVWLGDERAVPTEGLDELAVAQLRLELGGDRGAVE